MRKRIAFIGLAGSGKTTLANFVSKEFGYEKISIAAPLKKIVTDFLGRPIDKSLDRTLLVNVGQFLRGDANCKFPDFMDYIFNKKSIHLHKHCYTKNFWIQQLVDDLKEDGNYVLDDLRFFNEYEILTKENFCIVRIITHRDICYHRMVLRDGYCKLSVFDDDSEKDWMIINPNITIDNNGLIFNTVRGLADYVRANII